MKFVRHVTCVGGLQGWEAVEAKTEALDAFVNVASDMEQLMRQQQQWQVNDESVREGRVLLCSINVIVDIRPVIDLSRQIQGMVEALQMQVRLKASRTGFGFHISCRQG